MRFSMVAAMTAVTVIWTVLQRIILKQIDAYVYNWFGGTSSGNNSTQIADPAAGSYPNDVVAQEVSGNVRITYEAGYFYFNLMAVVLMCMWTGLWFNRGSILKHEQHITRQREMRGLANPCKATEWSWCDPLITAKHNTPSVPLFQRPLSSAPNYLNEEQTCADQCMSYFGKQIGGLPGFALFLALAAACVVYADDFRIVEEVTFKRGGLLEGLLDTVKSYFYSMPQKALEVEGWKWACSLAFTFVSGLIRDWWYEAVTTVLGPFAAVAGYFGFNVVKERKIAKTAKRLQIPAKHMTEQQTAVRRDASSASLGCRFRGSRDPQTAQPLTGVRKTKQWLLSRLKSHVFSAKGRASAAVTPAPAVKRALTMDQCRDIAEYRALEGRTSVPLERPVSVQSVIEARGPAAIKGPGPAPSAPPSNS
jgi:hypothetical protein